ncbi:MAG: RNA pyrophosphohydrolase [Caulobacterales bacterium]
MPAARDPDRYRPNVGLALFHQTGHVLMAKRIGSPPPYMWQMPQGGVDPGEGLLDAALRELEEEVGVGEQHVSLLEETPDWLYYEFPGGVRESLSKGRYLGQRQKWFAFRFLGQDSDIRLDLHTPEFTEWRWAKLSSTPALIVPFKRAVYEEVARRFARFGEAP